MVEINLSENEKDFTLDELLAMLLNKIDFTNDILKTIEGQLIIENEWLVRINETLSKGEKAYFGTGPIGQSIPRDIQPDSKPLEPKKQPKKKKTLEYIEPNNIQVFERSLMIENKEGQIAFIGKSLIEKVQDGKIWLTSKARKWFTEDNIQWKDKAER